MASSDIKQITLTGAAATELTGTNSSKKSRSSQKRGGNETKNSFVPSTLPTPVPAPSAPVPAPSAPVPAPSAPVPASSAPVPASSAPLTAAPLTAAPLTAAPLTAAPLTASTATEGGTKIIKVELKKRSTAKRVHLQPKRADALIQKKPTGPQTKKARKATLSIPALHKRMKRAKKMTRKVKEMSLTQLREHLIQKKLIKPTSKAPESVLRQMAADAQIVAGKAL